MIEIKTYIINPKEILYIDKSIKKIYLGNIDYNYSIVMDDEEFDTFLTLYRGSSKNKT